MGMKVPRSRCDAEQRKVLIDQIRKVSWKLLTREHSDFWKKIKEERDKVERIIYFGTVEMALTAVKNYERKLDDKKAVKKPV